VCAIHRNKCHAQRNKLVLDELLSQKIWYPIRNNV
jgi:hypothetical protein